MLLYGATTLALPEILFDENHCFVESLNWCKPRCQVSDAKFRLVVDDFSATCFDLKRSTAKLSSHSWWRFSPFPSRPDCSSLQSTEHTPTPCTPGNDSKYNLNLSFSVINVWQYSLHSHSAGWCFCLCGLDAWPLDKLYTFCVSRCNVLHVLQTGCFCW